MPAAAVPIAAGVIGAIGQGIAGHNQSKQAKAAMNAQLNYEGSPAMRKLRLDMGNLFRSQLGDIFSGDYNNMLRSRYREMLDPNYNQTLSNDVYGMLDQYRNRNRPQFEQTLQDSFNRAKTNLGGQYGIRYGTDAARIMDNEAGRASVGFEGDITRLFPQLFSTVGGLNLQGLNQARADQMQALSPILNFALQSPGSPNLAGYNPGPGGAANALGGIAGTLAQYPLLQQLYGSGSSSGGSGGAASYSSNG